MSPGHRARKAPRVRKGHKGRLETLERQDPPAQMERKGPRVILEPPVRKVYRD